MKCLMLLEQKKSSYKSAQESLKDHREYHRLLGRPKCENVLLIQMPCIYPLMLVQFNYNDEYMMRVALHFFECGLAVCLQILRTYVTKRGLSPCHTTHNPKCRLKILQNASISLF
jgi:hypothetical protein